MKLHHFSWQGKRPNNEDCLATGQGLLTVCDGMGGHNFGERASAFVCNAMLQQHPEVRPTSTLEIQQMVDHVQAELNNLLAADPALEGMGTTFAGLFRTPDVWYAAHVGDSRIYLFRPAERKLWHTWDHSLVGELMRTHEITTEAGRFHPLANRISRAFCARTGAKPTVASIAKIDEIKAGDILLLCTDGVIEAWADHELATLFADRSLTFDEKCTALEEQCLRLSKDNYTAIVLLAEAGDAFAYGENRGLDWTTFDEVEADYRLYASNQ